jgi:nucleotidyltransferase/DNA polymerase involved in DNA repair
MPPDSAWSGVWVVYVDLDAYYVSCELRSAPELRGRPVVVGPKPTSPRSRGVVLSASYEARAHGVRSAMPVLRAAELLPDAVWIPPHHNLYARTSGEFRSLLATRAPVVRLRSIDEAAVEFGPAKSPEVETWAKDLQRIIRETLDLPASIGASPYEVVAKIASDRAKPGGVIVVPPETTAEFLAPLPVRTIPGVGPKTGERLARIGVERIGDLRTVPPVRLRSIVGSYAADLRALAEGSPTPAGPEREGPRQRSVDRTLEEDLRDADALFREIDGMATDLSAALEEERLRFKEVIVRVRWSDFEQTQKSRMLPGPSEGAASLRSEGRRLLASLLERERAGENRAVRRLSLAAQGLGPVRQRQQHLAVEP